MQIQDPPKALGILGGSFDPVHNGHLSLAREARKRFQLDSVIFMPAFQSPHKLDRNIASAGHRLNMLRLALAGMPEFEISNLELGRPCPSYTIDTVVSLSALHPESSLHWIMGIDAFMALHTWKDASRLIASCNLLVSTRPGHAPKTPEALVGHLAEKSGASPYALPPLEEDGQWTFRHRQSGARLVFFPIPPVEASSSEIRRLIGAGKSARNMLPPQVENYIIDHRLYRTGSPPQEG